MEIIDYDDTIKAYKEYTKDFDTAWDCTIEIPAHIVSSKYADDLIDGNPILSAAKKKVTSVTVVKNYEDPEKFRYTMDCEKLAEQYNVLLKGKKLKAKADVIDFEPDDVRKLELKKEKVNENDSDKKDIIKSYPKMHIDYERKKVTINDKLIDLNPTDNEIKADIETFLSMFENYNDFVCDTDKLKDTHFKLVNALFCSPFIAKLRCTPNYAINNFSNNSSLPMILIITSTQSNCGKTFTISAIIKMMTGILIDVVNKKMINKDLFERCQDEIKSVPFFIDELDNNFLARIKDIIKNPQNCESKNNEEQPMIVFAGNDVTEPDEIIRRRCIFLRYEGGLPSEIDRSAYEGKGNAILRKLGTALYREYQRRMIDKVINEVELRTTCLNIAAEYYTDIMAKSSETLIEIFKSYNYDIPKYMRKLSWNDDYSANAKYIYKDSINQIVEEYKSSPNLFSISNEVISIEYGNNKNDLKKCESWKNTLPAEVNAEVVSSRDGCKLIFKRNEFEKFANFKFKRRKFFRKRR